MSRASDPSSVVLQRELISSDLLVLVKAFFICLPQRSFTLRNLYVHYLYYSVRLEYYRLVAMVFHRPGEGIKITTIVIVFDIMHMVLKDLYRPVQDGCSPFQHFNILSFAHIFSRQYTCNMQDTIFLF